MIETLNRLKNIQSEDCITVIANTHRTSPDNRRDPILLKNLVTEAEERLAKIHDKRTAEGYADKLKALADSIDHNHNLEGLLLFVNDSVAEAIRIPVKVTDRVVIDGTFATRDLIRALHQQQSYYVLVLSRQNARLIEASSDRLVGEIKGDFPMDYGALYTTDKEALTKAKGTDNLIEEFFNRVDKAFQEHWNKQPLPLVLVSEKRNHDHFLKVTENNRIIVTLDRNRDKEKSHHIVADAWPEVKEAFAQKNARRIEELGQAVAAQKCLSDFDDIWRAVREGRGQTLFVQVGLFQPAKIDGDGILLLEEREQQSQGFIDDVVDEMIEINLRFGGDTVFLEKGALADFKGLALTVRY